LLLLLLPGHHPAVHAAGIATAAAGIAATAAPHSLIVSCLLMGASTCSRHQDTPGYWHVFRLVRLVAGSRLAIIYSPGNSISQILGHMQLNSFALSMSDRFVQLLKLPELLRGHDARLNAWSNTHQI
jgi:hypothetical protein